jgi:hypothetical protein
MSQPHTGFSRDKALRRKRILIAVLLIAVLLPCIMLLIAQCVLRVMANKQLNRAAMGWSGRKLERILTSKVPDLPELLNVAPYSSHTIELLMAYQDAYAQSKSPERAQDAHLNFDGEQNADITYLVYEMVRRLNDVPDVQSLKHNVMLDTSLTTVSVVYVPRWKLFLELVKQPDFSMDIMLYPQQSDKQELAAGIGIDYKLILLYFWEKAESDAYESARDIIDLNRRVKAANARNVFFEGDLYWRYQAIAKFARSTQNATSASLLLAQLEKLPPKEDTASEESKVRHFLLMEPLAALRESRRAGIKFDINENASPLDLYWDCITLKRAGRPGNGKVRSDLIDISLPNDKPSVQFFARYSQLVRELLFLRHHEWEFRHLFPAGNSVASKLSRKQPYFDIERSSFDLARLNIAAYLYFRLNGEWPNAPADLVPQWFQEEPVCPAQMGGYIWSQRFQEFRVKKELDKYGIL